MAEEQKEQPVEKKKGGNLALIIVIVLLVLVLIGGAVAAFFVLGAQEEVPAESAKTEQTQTQDGSKDKKAKKPTKKHDAMVIGPMYPLDQFIVNLLSESGARFLKTTIHLELEAENEKLTPELDSKKSLIRDIIIRTLSSKTYEEISTVKGKDKLKEEVVEKINQILADGAINNIYFIDFVIQ